MELLILVIIVGLVGWWAWTQFNKPEPVETKTDSNTDAPYKVEAPDESAPAWHTAPPGDTKPVTVESVAVAALDVNHDGKVNLEDVKEAVKKVRKPKAEKAAVKKAADKKPAAKKDSGKPGRKPRAKKEV